VNKGHLKKCRWHKPRYSGPYITNVVLSAYVDQLSLNSSYSEDKYYIKVHGSENKLIKLYLYNGEIPKFFRSHAYNSVENQNQFVIINRTDRKNHNPDSWAFDLT
jgi:hypothetical protein